MFSMRENGECHDELLEIDRTRVVRIKYLHDTLDQRIIFLRNNE
jgi:hypothetical protein